MAKTSGLGDDLFVGGWHIGGDIQSLTINGGPNNQIDVTDITQSAHARLGGVRLGSIKVVAYHDNAVGGTTSEHLAFAPLPTADVIGTYLRGQAIGNPSACCNSRQVDYNPTKGADGSLTFAVDMESDAFGLEWGTQLTAGARTDTAATNGASNNFGAASPSFGAQAYLQAVSLTGTDVTVTLQDSADNITFANIAGGSFAQITSLPAPAAQRIATASNLQIRQYVRAITTTVGGFTSFTFQVTIAVNQVATVF